MPVFKTRAALELARNVRAFLNLEGGVVRGPVPGEDAGEVDRLRRSLESRDEEIARLRAERPARGGEAALSEVPPEALIWVFGNGRTGSTWLSHMMKDLREHRIWPEPNVGELFGSLYYRRAREGQLASGNFVLGNQQKETWLAAIRGFVLQSVGGRFPDLSGGGYLVIKEPHGSVGAPLIMQALPESRMVLLVRDPRDVAASSLDSLRKDSWGSGLGSGGGTAQISENPDAFVRNQAQQYRQNMGNSREAYEAHRGPKAMVRYEDLKADTPGSLRRLYSELEIPVDEAALSRVVAKHSWEAIPEEKKGEGKFYRKATPGGWREDLTPEQIRIVEEETASLMQEFYPGERIHAPAE